MNKNTLLKMGACACAGALIGFGIDMVVKKRKQKEVKTNEEVVKENVKKMSDAVDLVVKISCVVCAGYTLMQITDTILDYISEVDTKATVSNMLNFTNGAKLGLIDKDVLKAALETSLPSLDKTSKELVETYVHTAFPELLGGE